jgi:hypothetical protein
MYHENICRSGDTVPLILNIGAREIRVLASCHGRFNPGESAVGPARPRPTALLPPRSYGKPEAAAAVDRFLMMGIRMPETCIAVSKRQTINL